MELFLSHHWLLFSQIVCDWHSLFWNIVHLCSPNTPRWWVLKCLCLGPPRGGGWFIYCCRAGFITSLRETLFPAGQSNRHDAFINYKLQNWVLKKYPLHPWPAHQLTATLHPLSYTEVLNSEFKKNFMKSCCSHYEFPFRKELICLLVSQAAPDVSTWKAASALSFSINLAYVIVHICTVHLPTNGVHSK